MTPLDEIFKFISKGQIPPPGLFPEALLEGLALLSSFRARFSRLTPIERLLTTARHKTPDRVPCSPLVGGAYRRLVGAAFDRFSMDPDVAVQAGSIGARMIGGDLQLIGLDLSVEVSDFGQSIVYPENSTARPDYSRPLLHGWEDYRKVRRIDFHSAERMQKVLYLARQAVKAVGHDVVLAAVVSSPLSILGMMQSAEKMFKDCVVHPSEVMAAEEVITEVLIDYINGYRVHDLGREVPSMAFVRAVEKYRPKILALSAMMSTTMAYMKEIISQVKSRFPETVIMVGGAALDMHIAKRFGADGYAESAETCMEQTKKAIQRVM